MKTVLLICAEEWRYWMRSRFVLVSLFCLSFLIGASSLLTASRMSKARHERIHHQSHAEETFKAQPDRHPHRMVHYGHYVFRSPAPLAIFDPGIDEVTGQSIFLEGHHQNTAMFSDERKKPRLGGVGSLSVARVYQLLVPLFLIAIGYPSLIRERESQTLRTLLAQGVTSLQILLGKGLALGALVFWILLPALCLITYAMTLGEALVLGGVMYLSYGLYFGVWVLLILFVSTMVKERGVALGSLLAIWCLISLVLPRVGVAVISAWSPIDGKFQTDIKMMRDIRALGNGHNASDPKFAQFKAQTLQQYGVKTLEELPINYRGLLSQVSERKLTHVMNEYAHRRMRQESRQSEMLRLMSYLSPFVAIDFISRDLAGTDLASFHRFLREAEELRFKFVQHLNKVHEEQLSYTLDVNRNVNDQGLDAARVSSKNWQSLEEFRFSVASASSRMKQALMPFSTLVWWFGLLLGGMFCTSKKLTI